MVDDNARRQRRLLDPLRHHGRLSLKPDLGLPVSSSHAAMVRRRGPNDGDDGGGEEWRDDGGGEDDMWA